MSRTFRSKELSSVKSCFRRVRTFSEKRQQVLLRELAKEYGLNFGNRALNKKIADPYDDIYISALDEIVKVK